MVVEALALVELGGAGGGVASQINVRYRYVNKGHRSHQTSAAGGRFDTLLFKGVGVVVVVVVFCLRRARALARQRYNLTDSKLATQRGVRRKAGGIWPACHG